MKYTKSLLLGLIIVIFGLSSLSFWFGQKVSRRYTPLVEAALTIKLEATIAHLWFEEVVSGDRNEDINQVWGHLDQAEWYAQAMITGGENSKGVLIPLREEALLKTIQDVQIGLNSFRKIAQLRLMKQENDVGIGSEIDQKFDQVYENLFVQAGIVEQELKVQIAIANHRYKNIQITLQFGIFLWGLLLLWVIYRFEQNAMKLVETATKANRAKNSFLTIISHELRTPMNGVLGMTQLLRTTSLTEEQKDYCDIIMESGVRLVNTLTDILDFSKIEAESNNLTYSTFSLSKLVISSVKLFLGSAHAKGLALNYQIDPEIEDQVISDQEVLHRIFSNLVANGIKFTEKGEINIRLELIKKSEKVQRIGFVISDTGIGIPKEDQTDVFKPFKQVDGSSTRNFEGTGLGLFIVKSLVEMLGDEIKLEDNPSGGCRFVFEVTMEYSSAITQTKLENENPMTTYAPPLTNSTDVLIVEDNIIAQQVIGKLLRTQKVSFDVANSGEEAIECIQEKKYGLIFMDILMPNMDGYEVTKIIRNPTENPNHNTMIIALTALADSATEQKCLASGMNKVITKPIDFQVIKQLVVDHLI